MPPRTRKPDDQPLEDGSVVDAPQEQPQTVTPGMFQPAIDIVEGRMSTRMDSIANQLRTEMIAVTEGSAANTSAVLRKLEEINTAQQASAEAVGEFEDRIAELAALSARTPGHPVQLEDTELRQIVAQMDRRITELNQMPSADDAIELREQVGELSAAIGIIDNRVASLPRFEAPESYAELKEEVETLGVAIDELLGHQTGNGNEDGSPVVVHNELWEAGIEQSKHILSAIWAVMRDVRGVGKHGRYNASGTRYNFRAFDDVANAVGAAFRSHGVMVQSTVLDKQVSPYEVDGKRRSDVTLTIKYVFTSLVDGSTLEFEAIGESRDTSDKGHAKAMTAAFKSAVSQAFMLATGDEDPDQTRPGDDDAVEPNVRVPENETDVQRKAREAFEERRKARERTAEPEQDSLTQASRRTVDGVNQARERTAERVHADHAEGLLNRELGARPVEPPTGDMLGDGEHNAPLAGHGMQAPDSSYVGGSDDPQPGDPWATAQPGQVAEVDPRLVRAQQALEAAHRPGVTLAKLNEIIGLASKEGLMSMQVDGLELKRHLIAVGRTLAPQGQ